MSSILQISQAQQIKNKKRLVLQNRMLHEQVLTFQKQLNQFLTSVVQSTNPQTPGLSSEKQGQFQGQIQQQKKLILKLRSQLSVLKSKNIKENIQYILKQEDDLNILKGQLFKYRKQKQVIAGFKKDKLKKLGGNAPLNQHQMTLKNQLKQTIKFNRSSYACIVELERNIRKYHEIVDISRCIAKQNSPIISKLSYQQEKDKIVEADLQISTLKTQIRILQQKWKSQLNTLDDEYFQLQQLKQLKKKQLKQSTFNDGYFQSRMSVVRSQSLIESDRKRKEKVVASPKLKQQLQQYIKKQQQKNKKKISSQQTYLQIVQKPAVENMQDDKNLKTINNYKNNRPKIDKNVSAYQIQQNRSQRTWNNEGNSTLEQSIKSIQKEAINKNDKEYNKKMVKQSNKQGINKRNNMPRLLLKNIGLGTSFHQN